MSIQFVYNAAETNLAAGGTGDLVTSDTPATSVHRSFSSSLTHGVEYRYSILDIDGGQYEFGVGTWVDDVGQSTWRRDTVERSSNSGNPINAPTSSILTIVGSSPSKMAELETLSEDYTANPMTSNLDTGGFFIELSDGASTVGLVGSGPNSVFLGGATNPADPGGSLTADAELTGKEIRVLAREGKLRFSSKDPVAPEITFLLPIDPLVDPSQTAITAFAFVHPNGKNAFGTFEDTFDTGQNWLYERGARVYSANNPPPSGLTTKGDLLAYDTTTTRLGVGQDGYMLYADDSEDTGLRWGPAPTGTGDVTAPSNLTQHGIAVGLDGLKSIATIATGTAGLPLLSAGAASNPTFNELGTAGLGPKIVTSGKIADGAVGSLQIADDNVGNAKLAEVLANTLKGRAVDAGNPTDIDIAALAAGGTPAAGDVLLGKKSLGDLVNFDAVALGGTYSKVADDDVVVSQGRSTLNFHIIDEAQTLPNPAVEWIIESETGDPDVTRIVANVLGSPTTAGDLWTTNSFAPQRLPVGTNGQMLYADDGVSVGLRWGDAPTGTGDVTAAADLTQYEVVLGDAAAKGVVTLGSLGTSGQVLTSQGAGAAPQWAPGGGGGVNDPPAAPGELWSYDSVATNTQSLAPGADGDILLADSVATIGLKWSKLPNGSLADMDPWHIKLRNNAVAGAPEDALISEVSNTIAIPGATDYLLAESSTNVLSKVAGTAFAPSAHVGAGGVAHADVVAGGADGFMTGADKTRLDGMETGANVGITAVEDDPNPELGGDLATNNRVIRLTDGAVTPATQGLLAWNEGSIVAFIGADEIANVATPISDALVSGVRVTLQARGPGAGAALLSSDTGDVRLATNSVDRLTVDNAGAVSTSGNFTANGQLFEGVNRAWSDGNPADVEDLNNVTITGNTDGELLRWTGTAWINNTLGEAGIEPAGTATAEVAAHALTVNHPEFAGSTKGMVPASVGGTTNFLRADGQWQDPGSGGGSAHVIQDEGAPLTQRANLNFIGAGVTAADDSGNDATTVTINAGGDVTSPTGNVTVGELATYANTDGTALDDSNGAQILPTAAGNMLQLQARVAGSTSNQRAIGWRYDDTAGLHYHVLARLDDAGTVRDEPINLSTADLFQRVDIDANFDLTHGARAAGESDLDYYLNTDQGRVMRDGAGLAMTEKTLASGSTYSPAPQAGQYVRFTGSLATTVQLPIGSGDVTHVFTADTSVSLDPGYTVIGTQPAGVEAWLITRQMGTSAVAYWYAGG